MSGARYHEAGSGPHDPGSRLNERGERNCGCRHDGTRWLEMCATARAACEALHREALAETKRP